MGEDNDLDTITVQYLSDEYPRTIRGINLFEENTYITATPYVEPTITLSHAYERICQELQWKDFPELFKKEREKEQIKKDFKELTRVLERVEKDYQLTTISF